MPCCWSRSAVPRGRTTCGRFSRTCCAAGASVPERIDEVAHHYDLFGGVSPLTALTLSQASALEAHAARARPAAPRARRDAQLASVSDRHARGDVARRRPARHRRPGRGAAQLLGMPAVSRERPRRARRAWPRPASTAPEITYVGDWHEHPGLHRGQRRSHPAGVRSPAGWIAGPARGWSSPRTAFRHPWRSAIRTKRSSARRRAADRGRSGARPTGRSSIRAAAAVPAIPGSSPTSATTCGSERGRRPRRRGPLPRRLPLRSRGGALRPRRRSRRDLPARPASRWSARRP